VVLAVVVAGCAGVGSDADPGNTIATTASAPLSERIPVSVWKPDGEGPFPAIVLMHDCSGLGARSSGGPGRWARELGQRGYVVIMPDSFSTRGHPDGVCTGGGTGRRADVNPARRAHDAYGALAHARALSYVDGRRVGLMGASHGGTTVLAAMAPSRSESAPLARDKRAGFAAAVALYPRCSTVTRLSTAYRPIAPVLILIGEKDDWTPALDCRRLAEASSGAGHPVAIKIYPGAHHSFDSPHPERYVATRINPGVPGGRGATTGGHAGAWADSIREVTAFFARHLQPTK
jgi:dienelactone hydrolase